MASKTDDVLMDGNEFVVPTLSEAHPLYGATVAKKHELQQRRSDTVLRIAELAQRISRPATHRQTAEAARIDELLGDFQDADLVEIEKERAEYSEKQADLIAVTKAIEQIELRIRDLTRVASGIVCGKVRDEYRRRVTSVCDALLIVHEASASYYALADELNSKGVQWSALWAMPPLMVGHPQDTHSPMAQYLREAALHGFIPSTFIPQELR